MIQPPSKFLPVRRQIIAILLDRFAFLLRRLLHLLPVLIQAGEEKHLLAQAAARARDHVGHNLFVGMPKVRLPVHVIDGCRYVICLAHSKAP
jgi:hypothetical protein